VSRIARHVLNDTQLRRLWESRLADQLLPVAELTKPWPQLQELRQIEIRLLHQRALFEYLQANRIGGPMRNRLFAVFYGPKETRNAAIAEHRQYQLAVCSCVAIDHLIGVMHDSVSSGLLRLYEQAYAEYFGHYCCIARTDDNDIGEAMKLTMLEARQRAVRIRNRLGTARPEKMYSDLNRQIELARSGRYPVLNYMIV
jgi:hypothetical protein